MCGKIFRGKTSLRKHRNRQHAGKTYDCKLCDKKYTANQTLKAHMLQHEGKKPHACDICGQQYRHKSHLQGHIKTHTGERPYICELCGKAFFDSSGLNRHANTHRTDPSLSKGTHSSDDIETHTETEANTNVEDGQRAPGKLFMCPVCSMIFKSASELTSHTRLISSCKGMQCFYCSDTFTNEPALHTHVVKCSKEKQIYGCTMCSKIYYCKSSLRKHNYKHAGRTFDCKLCGKKYTASSTLRTHMLQHEGRKPHVCDICGQQFRQNNHLQRHIQTHTGERPYMCELCGKSFIDRTGLNCHANTHRTDRSLSFTCDECGMSYTTRSGLNNHKKFHRGLNKFPCHICNRTFTSKNSLLRHGEKHEKHSNAAYFIEPTIFCKICNRGFTNKRGLAKHMVNHKKGLVKKYRAYNIHVTVNRNETEYNTNNKSNDERYKDNVNNRNVAQYKNNANDSYEEMSDVDVEDDEPLSEEDNTVIGDVPNEKSVFMDKPPKIVTLNKADTLMGQQIVTVAKNSQVLYNTNYQRQNEGLDSTAKPMSLSKSDILYAGVTNEVTVESRDAVSPSSRLTSCRYPSLPPLQPLTFPHDNAVASREIDTSQIHRAPIVDIPLTDHITKTPIVNIPLTDHFTKTPIVNIPLTDHITKTPIVNIPLTDHITKTPIVNIPLTDHTTLTPIVNIPLTDHITKTPIVNIPLTDHTTLTPIVNIPLTDHITKTPIVNIPLTGHITKTPIVNIPLTGHITKTPIVNIPLTDHITKTVPIKELAVHPTYSRQHIVETVYDEHTVMSRPFMENSANTIHSDPIVCTSTKQIMTTNQYGYQTIMKILGHDVTKAATGQPFSTTLAEHATKSHEDHVTKSLPGVRSNAAYSNTHHGQYVDQMNNGPHHNNKFPESKTDSNLPDSRFTENICDKPSSGFKMYTNLYTMDRQETFKDVDMLNIGIICNKGVLAKEISQTANIEALSMNKSAVNCHNNQSNVIPVELAHTVIDTSVKDDKNDRETVTLNGFEMMCVTTDAYNALNDNDNNVHIIENQPNQTANGDGLTLTKPCLKQNSITENSVAATSEFNTFVEDKCTVINTYTDAVTQVNMEKEETVQSTHLQVNNISTHQNATVDKYAVENDVYIGVDVTEEPDSEVKIHVSNGQVLVELPIENLICNICEAKFSCKYSLRRHYLEHKSAEQQKSEGEHDESQEGSKDKFENTRKKRKKIEWRKFDIVKDGFRCKICKNKIYSSVDEIMKHVKSHEVQERKYICKKCPETFFTKWTLKIHKRSIHSKEVKRFICEVCAKSFNNKGHLHRHVIMHQKQISSFCPKCGKFFLGEKELKIHERSHMEKIIFTCEFCTKQFSTQSNLTRHKKSHVNGSSGVSRIAKFICSLCEKTFTSNNSLQVHMLIHSSVRPYTCECGSSFKQGSHLRRHKQLRHTEKSMKCDHCEKLFSDKISLMVHVRSHTGIKPYECDICGRGFSQIQNMKTHKNMHLGKADFPCPTCSQRFTTKMSMLRHCERHEREDKMNPESENYDPELSVRVRQTVVKKMADKTIHCETCNKCFTTKRGLAAHNKTSCRGMALPTQTADMIATSGSSAITLLRDPSTNTVVHLSGYPVAQHSANTNTVVQLTGTGGVSSFPVAQHSVLNTPTVNVPSNFVPYQSSSLQHGSQNVVVVGTLGTMGNMNFSSKMEAVPQHQLHQDSSMALPVSHSAMEAAVDNLQGVVWHATDVTL